MKQRTLFSESIFDSASTTLRICISRHTFLPNFPSSFFSVISLSTPWPFCCCKQTTRLIVLCFGGHCCIYPLWSLSIILSLTMIHWSRIAPSIWDFFPLFLIGLYDELPFAAKQENGTLPQYELVQEGVKQAHLARDKFKKVPTPSPLPPQIFLLLFCNFLVVAYSQTIWE